MSHLSLTHRGRAWLEASGERVESIAIESGQAAHGRVDTRVDDRAAARRSVDVSSEALGIVGRCDIIEDREGSLRVVEVKTVGARRKAVPTEAQTIQLALQRDCLEQMGHHVSGQAVWFVGKRATVEVDLPDDVRESARTYVEQTRAIVASDVAPPPLVDDPRCGRCSHAVVCMPDEIGHAKQPRRIAVRDPDGDTLHLTTAGSRASIKSGRIKVVRGDEPLADLPIERINGLVVHGNVDVSSALIREMLWRRQPVLWLTWSGRVVGYASSASSPNGSSRVLQRTLSAEGDLKLAREFVASKISNQATQLRRSSRMRVDAEVKQIRAMSRRALEARSVPELFGIEGEAAAIYFGAFPSMLAPSVDRRFTDSWPGRVGRGALDPLNVSLNLAYGLLLNDVVRAALACGLDPHAGFVHSSGRNKPALALDLMEQFRPIIADSVVLTAINNGELQDDMFTTVLGSARLRDRGRKALIAAYERRVATTFRHPQFGYEVSWRRAMEVQARLVV